jgi:hypothetical protein
MSIQNGLYIIFRQQIKMSSWNAIPLNSKIYKMLHFVFILFIIF